MSLASRNLRHHVNTPKMRTHTHVRCVPIARLRNPLLLWDTGLPSITGSFFFEREPPNAHDSNVPSTYAVDASHIHIVFCQFDSSSLHFAFTVATL